MKTIFKKIAAGLVLSSALLPAQAQEFRTSYFMQTSNFRHQMNPALIDAPYVSFPFMGNINVGATGNIGYKNFIYKLEGNPLYDQTTFMSPTVSASDFLGGLHDKNRADIYVNYNLFSVGFRGFKGMNIVELNLRSNTNITLPYELFEFMKTTGEKEFYQLHDIGARSQNYMELALGHSHRINDRLTVGAKAKFLFGVAYADFKVNQLNLTMNGDEWRVQGDARLKASVLKSEFDYEGPEKNAPDGRRRVKGLDDVSFGMPGFGMAFDLGASYKVMDDLTVSAGLTDLGFISWGKTKQASSAGDYTFSGFNNIYAGSNNTGSNKLGDQFEDLGDDLEEMFSVYDDGETSTTQALAATLNVGAEDVPSPPFRLPLHRPHSWSLFLPPGHALSHRPPGQPHRNFGQHHGWRNRMLSWCRPQPEGKTLQLLRWFRPHSRQGQQAVHSAQQPQCQRQLRYDLPALINTVSPYRG